jgi:hypothetical protein
MATFLIWTSIIASFLIWKLSLSLAMLFTRLQTTWSAEVHATSIVPKSLRARRKKTHGGATNTEHTQRKKTLLGGAKMYVSALEKTSKKTEAIRARAGRCASDHAIPWDVLLFTTDNQLIRKRNSQHVQLL